VLGILLDCACFVEHGIAFAV